MEIFNKINAKVVHSCLEKSKWWKVGKENSPFVPEKNEMEAKQ